MGNTNNKAKDSSMSSELRRIRALLSAKDFGCPIQEVAPEYDSRSLGACEGIGFVSVPPNTTESVVKASAYVCNGYSEANSIGAAWLSKFTQENEGQQARYTVNGSLLLLVHTDKDNKEAKYRVDEFLGNFAGRE